MKVNIYNEKKEKVGDISLKKEVFGCDFNEGVVSQYVRVYLANQRHGNAKVKTRAEVSGGGRKPWKQKGTGRARHGSIRSPIWVHGGVTYGPKPKDWSLKLPKNMKTLALFSALSKKALDKKIFFLDELKLDKHSTKKISEILKTFGVAGKVCLIIPKADEKITRSGRNIENVSVKLARNINAFDVLNSESLIFVESSVSIVYDTFLK